MHCGVRLQWSKCMLCNILEYCSQTLDIQWTEGIATHFIFIYDFIIIGNMLLNVFLLYNIENMVDIKNLKNFIMQQFVDFKYRIW